MSKAIIFTGGGAPTHLPSDLIDTHDYVIAADSGYDTAKRMGIRVDCCIGDFDSTRFLAEIIEHNALKQPKDKDESDTELALRHALDQGYTEYVLVGGGGFRMDHLFATYALFSRYPAPLAWYTCYETLHLVTGFRRFSNLEIGMTISLFPVHYAEKVVVTAKALFWPLDRYTLSMTSLSLSNRTNDSVLQLLVEHDKSLFVCFPVADRQD
ncbi:thiamine diphosphokinase [Sphaerochaeta sp.]|jgi:thiamine pyrophosphokinase|uniref:thiamine diphosphokinase n=1 Tax=Sphaerochaeta sp. TaxID=1972642 RepID=UPI002FCBA76B